jgi:hypothetical protein
MVPKRTVATIVMVLMLASSAWASIRKIELTKANQATSPVQFTLTTAEANGRVTIRLEVPRDQAPLEHLWRIDCFVRRDGKSVQTPVESVLANGRLVNTISLAASEMADAEIWIRTGPRAPLSEDVYIIKVRTFR